MLQKGTKAPYFEGQDENGNLVKLTDFAGKKLVLYFYPKDSTFTALITSVFFRCGPRHRSVNWPLV